MSSFTLYSQDGIRYEALTAERQEAAIAMLTESFHVGEPLTTSTGCSRESTRAFFDMFVPQMLSNGLSVAAVSEDTNDLVGVFIAEDFAASPPAGVEEFVGKYEASWGPVFAILDDAEEKLKQEVSIPAGELPDPGRIVHQWCVGVSPACARRGIGERMTRVLLQQAALLGFEMSFSECTGAFSKKLSEKSGMNPSFRLEYASWEFEGSRPFASAPAPHTCTTVMCSKHK